MRVKALSRGEGLATLEAALVTQLNQLELVALGVRRRGLAGLFDDPTFPEICEAAYKECDAEVPE